MRCPASESGDRNMVAVAQLAEHKVVVLGVAGSSPVGHPFGGESEIRSQKAGTPAPSPCPLPRVWGRGNKSDIEAYRLVQGISTFIAGRSAARTWWAALRCFLCL